jgi:hypothetical protein
MGAFCLTNFLPNQLLQQTTAKMNDTSTPDDSRAAIATKDTTRSTSRQPTLSLLHALAVLLWIGALASCVWLFSNRSFLLAGLGGSLSIMAIPVVAARSWKERMAATLVMPFVGLGLVGGVALFFALLTFSWFERVFNTKGGGLLGLVGFAFGLSFAGGYVGYRCLTVAGRSLLRRTR